MEDAVEQRDRRGRHLAVTLGAITAVVVAVVVFVASDRSADKGAACRRGATTILGGIHYEERAIRIRSASGRTKTGCALVAVSSEQRSHGLSGVASLNRQVGMLFIFPADTRTGFWMRDTSLPLSIAWFAADGTFVSAADMEPCHTANCPTYTATAQYRYALEVAQGKLDDLGVDNGSRLELNE